MRGLSSQRQHLRDLLANLGAAAELRSPHNQETAMAWQIDVVDECAVARINTNYRRTTARNNPPRIRTNQRSQAPCTNDHLHGCMLSAREPHSRWLHQPAASRIARVVCDRGVRATVIPGHFAQRKLARNIVHLDRSPVDIEACRDLMRRQRARPPGLIAPAHCNLPMIRAWSRRIHHCLHRLAGGFLRVCRCATTRSSPSHP